MALTKREEKYDELIYPLMGKIVEICKKHDIPMIASFQLNDDRKGDSDVNEDGDPIGPFYCTTRLFSSDDAGKKITKAGIALAPDPPARWRGEVHTAAGVEVVTSSDPKELGFMPHKGKA